MIIDNLDSQDGTIDYVYDNNGNTLVKRDNTQVTPQITRFIYDSRNQLSQTVRGPPLSEVNLGYYDYNYMGDRVRHLVSDRGDIEYIYDGKSVLEERSLSNTNLVAHYRYSDRLISLNTGNDEQYYHYSAQRTTVNLSNGSGNTLVSYRTDVWGRVTQQEGNSTNRHIFTGQEHDSNTGLIYFGARFYDPDTARFINEDSYLGESSTAPSLHRYLYAYANPALYYDPTGHAALIGEIGQFLMDTSATLLNQVDEDAGLIETAFYGFTGGVTGLLGGIFGTANFAANLVTSTPIFSDRVRREANEELDGVFGQVHYILNNKKAFANQVASSVGSTLGDAAKGNSNAIAKIIASGVGFLGTKGQNSILSASRTATVVSASRSVTNSIRQSKLISSAKSTIERAISSGGNRISVASKSAAGGKSSSHMNLRALLTSRFGKGDNGDVPNRGRKATADSRPIQVSGITNDLDVSLLRLDGQSIINNPFLSRVRSQLNKYDVGVNYRYGDVSHRNLGKATQHLDGRIDIDIYKQNAFSSKDSLRTYVHESSHAVAAARGRKIGTVADEYHAFRREFLFINNRRPKFNERKTLYNEVKKLYDDVPIGDTPRLFRK